jgi:hypothetical protein
MEKPNYICEAEALQQVTGGRMCQLEGNPAVSRQIEALLAQHGALFEA